MRLKDKVAIVTGAAHGIGLAIARRYVAEGARVTIADIDAAAGEAAARALGQARFVATDVGDAGNAENVVAETCRAFGDLDILVNNAGIIHGADFLDLTPADFDRVLRVNLKGAFLVGQAAARRMVAQVKAYHRGDDLRRRRPARAQLHRAGRGEGAGVRKSGRPEHLFVRSRISASSELGLLPPPLAGEGWGGGERLILLHPPP